MGRVVSTGGKLTPDFGQRIPSIDLTFEDGLHMRTLSQDMASLTGKSQLMARAALDAVGEDWQVACSLLMSDMSVTVVDGGPCELATIEAGMAVWVDSEEIIVSGGDLAGCTLLRVPRCHGGKLRLFSLEPLEMFVLTSLQDSLAPGWALAPNMSCPEISAGSGRNTCRTNPVLQKRMFHPGPVALDFINVEIAAFKFITKHSGARPPMNSRKTARTTSPPSIKSVDVGRTLSEELCHSANGGQDASNSSEISSENVAVKYDMLHHVGSGAFGSVHCAKAKSGATVAIKCIPKEDGQEMREVRMLQKVSHPCIVALLDSFTDADLNGQEVVHIVMEYMPTNLHLRIGGKPLQVEQVHCYASQLLQALGHLGTLQVCHRDVKPENILLAGQVMKLADFGSAKVLGDEPSSSYICSRWWRAPELILGASRYSMTIDWWSCGCVIGEMMSGAPIFTGDSSWGQMYAILRILGTPSAAEMEALTPKHGGGRLASHLERLVELRRNPRPWAEVLPAFAQLPKALELPQKLLAYAPTKRWSPAIALNSAFIMGGTGMSATAGAELQGPSLGPKPRSLASCSQSRGRRRRSLKTALDRPKDLERCQSVYLGKRGCDALSLPYTPSSHRWKKIRMGDGLLY